MLFDMIRCPSRSTSIAEFILATTSHMITSLSSLNHHFAFLTLTIMKRFEEFEFKWLAFSLVGSQKAFWTVFGLTSITNQLYIVNELDQSDAMLLRTQFDSRRVFARHCKGVQPLILILNIWRQVFKKLEFHIECLTTPFVRTVDFLKLFDFVNCVLIETIFAKIGVMLAITEIQVVFVLLKLVTTDFAYENVL